MSRELMIKIGEFEKAAVVFMECMKKFDFTKKQEVIISYDPCRETKIEFKKCE